MKILVLSIIALLAVQASSFNGEGILLYAVNSVTLKVYVNSALIDTPVLTVNTPYSIYYNLKSLDFIEIHVARALSDYIDGHIGINSSILIYLVTKS